MSPAIGVVGISPMKSLPTKPTMADRGVIFLGALTPTSFHQQKDCYWPPPPLSPARRRKQVS